MKIPVYCSLAQLNYKQCLVPCKVFLNSWFKAHTHVHYTHSHTPLPWMRVSMAIYSLHLQSRTILSAFSYDSCFDRFLIEFSQCLCACLCLCILICRQGFCFHHTVSAVYGELFASQDVYSVSFLPTALHICCHFITDIYLTLCACQDTLDKSQLFCVLPHTWVEGKGRKWSYFLLPAVIFIGISNSTASLFITKHILSQRESGFSEVLCTQ